MNAQDASIKIVDHAGAVAMMHLKDSMVLQNYNEDFQDAAFVLPARYGVNHVAILNEGPGPSSTADRIRALEMANYLDHKGLVKLARTFTFEEIEGLKN